MHLTFLYPIFYTITLQFLQGGYTALHVAAWFGHSEIVQLLMIAGATDIPNKV